MKFGIYYITFSAASVKARPCDGKCCGPDVEE